MLGFDVHALSHEQITHEPKLEVCQPEELVEFHQLHLQHADFDNVTHIRELHKPLVSEVVLEEVFLLVIVSEVVNQAFVQ